MSIDISDKTGTVKTVGAIGCPNVWSPKKTLSKTDHPINCKNTIKAVHLFLRLCKIIGMEKQDSKK